MIIFRLAMLAILATLGAPAAAQTCPPEVCAPVINATADAACARARAVELRVDEYRTIAEEAGAKANACSGKVEALEKQLSAKPLTPPPRTWTPPLWLVLPLRGAAVAATAVAAFAFARGLPPELVVGFAVAGLGSFVVDLAITLLD